MNIQSCCESGDLQGAQDALSGTFRHLNAHEPDTPWCLCSTCLHSQGQRMQHGDMTFVVDCAVSKDKVLFYWLPDELADDRAIVRAQVARKMDQNLSAARFLGVRDRTLSPWRLRR